MRILVLGAYGLIGSHVAARLTAESHAVVGLGRDVEAARRRFPATTWIACDLRLMTKPSDWASLLEGVDAVVNCAGALQDSPRDDLAAVHVSAPLALAEACHARGPRRFVHISAMGADEGRTEPFSATKREFERKLAPLELEWIILRPGLVWSPQAYGGSALLRGLAGFPLVLPVVYPDAPIQIVGADDVAEAVVRALAPSAPTRFVCDLAHPDRIALGDLLARLRGWLGLPPATQFRLPRFVPRLLGRTADALAFAGWRSPMRSAALDQLRAGVTGEVDNAKALLGFSPASLNSLLLQHSAGIQERWFARLYFLKPLTLGVLSLFWLASGAISLVRIDFAANVLTVAGWSQSTAHAAVLVGALIDLSLGFAAFFRRSARPALLGMAAVSLFYLAAASLWRSDLWLDPLGSLVKTIPGLILALVGLALQDER